jgi:hypothetical protein
MEQFLRVLRALRDFVASIRSLFALYVLIYSVPQLTPFYLFYMMSKRLFIHTGAINYPAFIIAVICGAVIIAWNLFFLLFFTKERTKNPHLYGRNFMCSPEMITDTGSEAKTFGESEKKKEDETIS